MIKVLVVFHDANYYSGGTRSMLDLVIKWNASKVKITALFPDDGSAVEFVKENGIDYKIIPFYNVRKDVKSKHCVSEYFKGVIKKSKALKNVKKNRKWFQEKDFDYVYSNTGAIYFGYYVAEKFKIRHVWHIREFGAEDQERIHYDGERAFIKKLNKSYKIIAISKAIASSLKGKGANADKIEIIYDDVLYQPSYVWDGKIGNDEQLVALSCGVIQKNKGHITAIQAVEKAVNSGINIKLIIAGDTATEYFKELKSYVETHELTANVEFAGFVNDMQRLRSKCHLGIVASYAEAFGRITIEGMLSGLLMLGSNSYGTAELIEDGETGFLFMARNADDLYEKIKLVNSRREDIPRVIAKAIKYAQNYSEGSSAKKIFNIMKKNKGN